MENATKALLIAAGVLFAVILISIAVIAYSNISGYYSAQQSNVNQEQLAKFNNEYAAYDRELTGFELVSLINKVIDFNEYKEPEGYEKMSVSVTINQSNYYSELFKRFKSGTYVYDSNNIQRKSEGSLKSIIEDMGEGTKNKKGLEGTYTAGILTKLESNIGSFKLSVKGRDDKSYNPNGDEERGKSIKEVLGKEYQQLQLPTKAELEQYGDYLTFKRGNFRSAGAAYKNGQIISFSFTQE